MKSDYENALDYIYAIEPFAPIAGTHRMKKLLKLMANPQDNLKIVHVGGTNGKGTCSNYIAKVMQEAGYKTGLYTSPFIVDFRERFQINSEMISKEELLEEVENVRSFAEQIEDLTQFEFITAIAFNWFAKKDCDVVVLEVGLGGRYDATNAIKSTLVSVIMSISLDHTHVLGDTVEKIAFDKAGIIKEHTPVVLYPVQEPETIKVISEISKLKFAPLIITDDKHEIMNEGLSFCEFNYNDFTLEIPFSAVHQIYNACTAYDAIQIIKDKGFDIEDQHIKSGFKNMKIAARTELLSENPPIILDGSHNEGGALALKDFIDKHFKNTPVCALIAMVKDKDYDTCLKILSSCFSKIICTQVDSPRTVTAEELAEIAKKYCKEVSFEYDHDKAVKELLHYNGVMVVCGSLYLVSSVRPKMLEKAHNDIW